LHSARFFLSTENAFFILKRVADVSFILCECVFNEIEFIQRLDVGNVEKQDEISNVVKAFFD
jgi:hypothetical protein